MTKARTSILFRQLYSRTFTRSTIERIHDGVGALEARGVREPAFLHHLEHELKPRLVHMDVHDVAANFMCEIIGNHPFWDGNKRTGFGTAVFLLAIGLRAFEAEAEEVERFCKVLARGYEEATSKGSPPPTTEEVAEWLRSHSGRMPFRVMLFLASMAIMDWTLWKMGQPEGALPLFMEGG
jgi:death-on-curing family protein